MGKWERYSCPAFLNFNRLIYHQINQLVRDSWAAEDLMQTTVEKLIERITLLRTLDRDSLVNYIITAAKNRAKNYLRDQNRYTMLTFEEQQDSPDLERGREEMDFRLIKMSDMERLAFIWPKLDERSRYVLEGRYYQGKSSAEMAKELGKKPDSVRMALTRARKVAFQMLEEVKLK